MRQLFPSIICNTVERSYITCLLFPSQLFQTQEELNVVQKKLKSLKQSFDRHRNRYNVNIFIILIVQSWSLSIRVHLNTTGY